MAHERALQLNNCPKNPPFIKHKWGQTPLSTATSTTFLGLSLPFDAARRAPKLSISSRKRSLPSAHPLWVASRMVFQCNGVRGL